MRYIVIVGNIGSVYNGNNKRTAERIYSEYVSKSKQGNGRARHESVTFFDHHEIAKEYTPEALLCD